MIYTSSFSFVFSPEMDYVFLSIFSFLFHLPSLILLHFASFSMPHYSPFTMIIIGLISAIVLGGTKRFLNKYGSILDKLEVGKVFSKGDLALGLIYIAFILLFDYRRLPNFCYSIAPLTFVYIRKRSISLYITRSFHIASYIGSWYLGSSLLFSFLFIDLVRLFLITPKVWSMLKQGILSMPPFLQTLLRNSVLMFRSVHKFSEVIGRAFTVVMLSTARSVPFSEEEKAVLEGIFSSRPEFITKIVDGDEINELHLFGLIIKDYWFAMGKSGYTLLSSCKKIEHQEPTDCSICLSASLITCKLNCEHEFCPECLLAWTIRSPECPLCRKKID